MFFIFISIVWKAHSDILHLVFELNSVISNFDVFFWNGSLRGTFMWIVIFIKNIIYYLGLVPDDNNASEHTHKFQYAVSLLKKGEVASTKIQSIQKTLNASRGSFGPNGYAEVRLVMSIVNSTYSNTYPLMLIADVFHYFQRSFFLVRVTYCSHPALYVLVSDVSISLQWQFTSTDYDSSEFQLFWNI